MANNYGKGFEHMDPVVPQGFQAAADAPETAAQRQPRADGPAVRRANPAAWETRVPLAFPLVVEGVGEVNEIVCRRITGQQLADLIMRMPEDVTEAELREEAYALICGVHPDVMNALEAGDLEKVMEAIRPFLPAALRDDLDLAALAAAAAPGAGV